MKRLSFKKQLQHTYYVLGAVLGAGTPGTGNRPRRRVICNTGTHVLPSAREKVYSFILTSLFSCRQPFKRTENTWRNIEKKMCTPTVFLPIYNPLIFACVSSPSSLCRNFKSVPQDWNHTLFTLLYLLPTCGDTEGASVHRNVS